MTSIGVSLLVPLVPSPSCPIALSPQHFAVPFASAAQEELVPALIWVTPVSPTTSTGVSLLVRLVPSPLVPSPSRPFKL
jgi:hypothetical protein